MIKNVVIKKRDVLSKINTREDDDCFKDCHDEGNVNKNHFNCLFYRESSANDERLTWVRQPKFVEDANKQAINKGPKITPITIFLKRRFKGSGVLCCQKCEKVWQRDVNAARNIMIISKAIWSDEGRPEAFKLKKT
ncbi:uncharacterized protein EV154DRAFT_479179 [Mucor mucedo]|uniref:uncharacterized protein n=1 Tax=Mucor mucedo TaxID=29922 RepID=UPI00221E7FF1|nr:uncharacterized protein EV154DRAFT_479179 [Mucor mucedo]KAI7893655.1 hypothetical protein EV154DRAFT_479179 [Mucor mucedo]